MQRVNTGVSFTEGVVWKQMLRFFLPIMLGTLFQQLYSTVDAVILGRFVGKNALAAVGGTAFVLISLVVNFFVGLASGASVVIAQHFGANDRVQVEKSVHTAMSMAVCIGAVMTVLGMFAMPLLLPVLDTPAQTMADSVAYLRWYFVAMIPSMIYNMGSGILRAVGDSRRPLYFLIVCAGVNTALDLVFVAVFHWGVAGAAIATSISQVVCAVLVLRTLRRQDGCCRLDYKKLGFDRPLLSRMLFLGFPAGLQTTMYSITNLFVQKATNLLGADAVAAWSAFWKLDGIYWPICGAIGIAVMSFVGQNYGAGKKERIFQSIRTGLVLHLSFSLLYCAVLYLTRRQAIALFCDDQDVIAQGVQIVCYIFWGYPLFSCSEVFSAAMRGVGNAVKPALLTFLGVCALRLAILFAVTFPHLSDWTIALCYPTTWAASSLLFLLYYKFGSWMPGCPGRLPQLKKIA